eukprot:SM000159S01758  [mRNA]  locus=s159:62197:67988:- [translate_table: standard]
MSRPPGQHALARSPQKAQHQSKMPAAAAAAAAAGGAAADGKQQRRDSYQLRGIGRWIGAVVISVLVALFTVASFVFEQSLQSQDCSVPADGYAGPPNLRVMTWMSQLQFFSDFLIALAYFSIPLELLYFMSRSQVFPHRWLLLLCSSLLVLATNTWLFQIVKLWSVNHVLVMQGLATFFKVVCAVVSCFTAVALVYIVPELLAVKIRELYLRNKAEELDREVGLIKTQEETGRMVWRMTDQIRTSLDRGTILNTTLFELARHLELANCAVFMPSTDGTNLELSHALHSKSPAKPISVADPLVSQVLASDHVEVIRASGPLAEVLDQGMDEDCSRLAAVRLPLLQTTEFHKEEVGLQDTPFALMVLALPSNSTREWQPHEIYLVEVVADQVAIALSHAAVLELYKRNLRKLEQQSRALDVAKHEARAAHDARDNFLSVMNHEMRTPMHAIIALLSLFDDAVLPPEQRVLVRHIKSSSLSLYKLIDDVLDYSLLEDGNLSLNIRAFFLHDLFFEAQKSLDSVIQAKEIDFAMHIEPEVPLAVLGDHKRLLQILLNVIDNACKFTGWRGTVSVTASNLGPGPGPGSQAQASKESRAGPTWEVGSGSSSEGGSGRFLIRNHDPASSSTESWFAGNNFRPGFDASPDASPMPSPLESPRKPIVKRQPAVAWPGPTFILKVEVKDNGHGVEPGVIPKLFHKFVQADSTYKRKFGGCGLGLSICRGLCRLHGGDVVLESQGLGKGTTVTFAVQLGVGKMDSATEYRGRAIRPVQEDESSLADRLHGLRLLVVDDNATNLIVAKRSLQSLGCDVTLAQSGVECLAFLQDPNHGFKLILLDLCMPDLDGFEVFVRIYHAFAGRQRPLVVAYTANTEKETRSRCHSLGMDGIITKPINRDDLGRVLCTLLGL